MSDNDLSQSVEPRQAGIDPDRLKDAADFVTTQLQRLGLPGAGLMIARHGQVVMERYWGTCGTLVRVDEPYDATVINQLYSFSKPISATVVAIVHQEGLLDYDQPVCRHIPEFAGQEREAITLRHCLTHSAGIPGPKLVSAHTPAGWQRAMEVLCHTSPEWPPGSRTAYHSRSGMFLAAEATRRVTGMADWHELCRGRLFGPLGAASLGFAVPRELRRLALTPYPPKLPGRLGDRENLGHPGAGGFGTVRDALKVVQLHLNAGQWNGRTILKPAELAAMHTVQFADQIAQARSAGRKPDHEYWGLGWLLRGTTTSHWFGFGSRASERAFGHAGIGTVMGIGEPDRGLAIMFMTTNEPPHDDVVALRNGLTDRIVAAVVD